MHRVWSERLRGIVHLCASALATINYRERDKPRTIILHGGLRVLGHPFLG